MPIIAAVDPVPAHYEKAEAAAEYRRRFAKSWSRRLSNTLELRMLRKALGRVGDCETLLDVPCGAGRLGATLARCARSVVGVDAAKAMIVEARRALAHRQPASRFVQASAFALPFPDRSFDAAVCWRLLQHFPSREDRARIIRELGRVTRRAIVLSFSDAGTRRARRLAARPRSKPGRVAFHRDELGAEIAACGLEVERFYRLFGPLSVVGAVLIRVP